MLWCIFATLTKNVDAFIFMGMPLLTLIILIAAIGLIVWLVTTYIPMSAGFKKAIVVVAVVCLIILILQVLGVWDAVQSVRVGKP